jgi:hypothetical protein
LAEHAIALHLDPDAYEVNAAAARCFIKGAARAGGSAVSEMTRRLCLLDPAGRTAYGRRMIATASVRRESGLSEVDRSPATGGKTMKAMVSIVSLIAVGGMLTVGAAELKNEVKVEIQSADLHADMAPGMYVCAEDHLHIKGTVQNLTELPVGPIKVAGKVFDANGKVLGTATASTKRPVLNPNDTADVNLEFLAVSGALIKQVKNQTLEVVAVSPKP